MRKQSLACQAQRRAAVSLRIDVAVMVLWIAPSTSPTANSTPINQCPTDRRRRKDNAGQDGRHDKHTPRSADGTVTNSPFVVHRRHSLLSCVDEALRAAPRCR